MDSSVMIEAVSYSFTFLKWMHGIPNAHSIGSWLASTYSPRFIFVRLANVAGVKVTSASEQRDCLIGI